MLIPENSILYSLGHMEPRFGSLLILSVAHRVTKFSLGKAALAFTFPILDKDVIRTKVVKIFSSIDSLN
jgi:hypothetical protein